MIKIAADVSYKGVEQKMSKYILNFSLHFC